MPRISGGTVVKLLIFSLLVGLVLAGLNVGPQDVFQYGIDNVEKIFNWAVDLFGKAFTYILLGAVVVIPIWLVFYLLRMVRGKS